jgi:CRP-like cAMP-binding protein
VLVRQAVREDLGHAALVDAMTGILFGARDDTLSLIAERSRVVRIPRDAVLFDQGAPTVGMGIYVVLEGRFEIRHLTQFGELVVAEDGPGTVIADVEMLVEGVPPEVTQRGAANTARATVTALQESRVLHTCPASTFFETEDFRVAANMAKLLAVKLLRRNARLDESITATPRDKYYRYLRGLVTEPGSIEAAGAGMVRVKGRRTQAMACAIMAVEHQTLSKAVNGTLRRQGLRWTGDDLVMTTEFHERLLNDFERLVHEGTRRKRTPNV